MHSPDVKAPALAIWALGLTQIVGYGTLFYSFSVLAPAMALELALPQQWVFAALSAALFLGSLFAPIAGRWADRFGAGRVMTAGSLAASLALAACALAPGRIELRRGTDRDGTGIVLRALRHRLRGNRADRSGRRAAQHHASHAHCRLRLDAVLAADQPAP